MQVTSSTPTSPPSKEAVVVRQEGGGGEERGAGLPSPSLSPVSVHAEDVKEVNSLWSLIFIDRWSLSNPSPGAAAEGDDGRQSGASHGRRARHGG